MDRGKAAVPPPCAATARHGLHGVVPGRSKAALLIAPLPRPVFTGPSPPSVSSHRRKGYVTMQRGSIFVPAAAFLTPSSTLLSTLLLRVAEDDGTVTWSLDASSCQEISALARPPANTNIPRPQFQELVLPQPFGESATCTRPESHTSDHARLLHHGWQDHVLAVATCVVQPHAGPCGSCLCLDMLSEPFRGVVCLLGC